MTCPNCEREPRNMTIKITPLIDGTVVDECAKCGRVLAVRERFTVKLAAPPHIARDGVPLGAIPISEPDDTDADSWQELAAGAVAVLVILLALTAVAVL